jgi:hypothetical protein
VTKKQPRKVALIDVRDCPREDFDSYWQITVIEPPLGETEFAWRAKILSYQPVGYTFEGKTYSLDEAAATWPQGMPRPQYPSDSHLARAKEFAAMTPAQQQAERARQDEYRSRCAAAHSAVPQPVHLVEETLGVAADKDGADKAAQEWVRKKMKGRRKPKATLHGYAIPLPVDPLGELVRDVFDELRYRWRRHVAPLLAIAYSTTIRNNKQNQTRDAIDGGAGAGLLRIYDGTRPASCGTATTLGAELTFSDPCAPAAASGVLTASAITADASANATITATWFRAADSTGTCCIDGNVGTSGSDMNLNSTSIASGVQVSCSSFAITGGNA